MRCIAFYSAIKQNTLLLSIHFRYQQKSNLPRLTL